MQEQIQPREQELSEKTADICNPRQIQQSETNKPAWHCTASRILPVFHCYLLNGKRSRKMCSLEHVQSL